ncbi:MAG: hypothetical protein ABI479_03315 [Gallionella sp.]
MIPASFSKELLHSDRLSENNDDLGKLFVRLVYELFKDEYHTLSYHDGGGKDGAIDLWSDASNERHVFECKQFGTGRKQQAWESSLSSWKKVQKNLEKNLLRGPCQSQYRPWYSDHQPRIVRYTFIVSCAIAPAPDRMDELRHIIKSAFEELSTKSSDLIHLKDIAVDIVDWNALRRRLEAQPQVLFKWFSNRLPVVGLRQLTQNRQLTDFRRYQQEDILPYYSLRAHLDKHPSDAIQDEDNLWKSLVDRAAGLVITGVSGIGKSRLMLELGKLALHDGWLVFEAEKVGAETIDSIARSHSSQGVLFLFDYLENLPAFRDISSHIVQLVGYGNRVRLIASARESFVKNEQIFDDSMIDEFKHSPEEGENSAWWSSYRRAAVSHITGHLGVEMHGDLSAEIPAVAVLESGLLRARNSPTADDSAKSWAGKHLSTLNREKVSKRNLALLAAQCPLDEEAYARLSGDSSDAFVALINSGWIEARDAETGQHTYWVVHDYLADHIVLDWIETEGPRGLAKSAEIRALLNLAYSLNTLGSVIATLQRIVGKVNGFGLEVFSNLLESEIAANREIWKLHRQDILYTRLLPPSAKVLLLHRLGDYWKGVESETWFQLEIAVLAKILAASTALKDSLPREALGQFELLVVSLAPTADERNMLVTYGLRLLPKNEHIQQIALGWLKKFENCFCATYVIRAWLDMNLPWSRIENSVGVWLTRFAKSRDAQYVLAAWLRASGADGATRFKSEILEWCEKYSAEIAAQHVYSAWLDASGSTQAISVYIQPWLAKNLALKDEPSFLFKRWLRAGGKASVILPYLKQWLDRHGSSDSASYVYAAAVDVAELSQLIKEPMLTWINTNSTSVLAKHCLIEWLRAGHDRGLVAKHIRDWLSANGNSSEAGEVIGKWLEAKGKLEMVRPYAMTWLDMHSDSPYCSFLLKTLLERESVPDEVLKFALRWLESKSRNQDAEIVLSAWLRGHHDVECVQQAVMNWCQCYPTEMQANHIYEQWLLAGGNHQLVSQNIMAWLAKHDRELDAGRVLSALSRAGIPFDPYQENLKKWLEFHNRNREATFLYSAWLADSERNPILLQNSIRAWLESNATWKDADFVLNAWLKRIDTSTEIVRAGYERWLGLHRQSHQAKVVIRNWDNALERERRNRISEVKR